MKLPRLLLRSSPLGLRLPALHVSSNDSCIDTLMSDMTCMGCCYPILAGAMLLHAVEDIASSSILFPSCPHFLVVLLIPPCIGVLSLLSNFLSFFKPD